ncbi:MAG: hypothetical protein NTZ33_05415 [Bacteroidetes bacterium]|nr:hypothetical protein [Bacteroidota bacterium]
MKDQAKWVRIVYIVGVVLSIIGLLDPMEGSVVILLGCALTAITTYIAKDRHQKIFLINFILMLIGVFFLFYISSLGGLGEGALSWWWGILMLPYPVAVLGNLVLLIVRSLKKKEIKTEE